MQRIIFSLVLTSLLGLAAANQVLSQSDNGRITFSSNRTGNYDVYVMTGDGTNQQRLTSHVNDDVLPTWSPDGKRIAFCSERDGDWEIYSMKADGTDLKKLTENTTSDRAPSWSPDGRFIAFHAFRDGNWELYIMNADGQNQRRVTVDTVTQTYPVWSPDGTYLLYHYYEWQKGDNNWEVYRIQTDGKNANKLTTNAAADLHPSWSPDGKHIAFWSDREGTWDLFIQNENGSNQRKLLNNPPNPAELSAVAWSPDSQSIVFPANHDLERIMLDGSGRRNLTNRQGNDIDPEWIETPKSSLLLQIVPTIAGVAARRNGGGQNGSCPDNGAPTLAEIVATRTTLSFGRNKERIDGVNELPGFTATFFDLVAPRRISLDGNGDQLFNGLDPIVSAAEDLPSYTTLLVAEGSADSDRDPLVFHWRIPNSGTYYSTGSEGSSFAAGEIITDLSQYNRNSIIWEATSLLFPVLDHDLMGGSTSLAFYVTDNPTGRNVPLCPLLRQKSSPDRFSSLNYGDVVHLELELLGRTTIPDTHPDPDYRGGIEVDFFAQIRGNYEAATFTTFRVDCGDDAETLLDEGGVLTGGVLQCQYKRQEVGDMVTITTVGSSFGPGDGTNPYVNPVGTIPFTIETFHSFGGTIGDTMTIQLEPDAGTLSVQLWDSGPIKDDAFLLYIDGSLTGQTPAGSSNLFFIDSLFSGTHTMEIHVKTAPDNIGTYTVRLFGGATFSGGGDTRTAGPPQGTIDNYTFTIP